MDQLMRNSKVCLDQEPRKSYHLPNHRLTSMIGGPFAVLVADVFKQALHRLLAARSFGVQIANPKGCSKFLLPAAPSPS